MKKVNWFVVLAGGAVGLAAVLLTALGNPVNMGFCIACFLRDIVGACGMHGAAGAPETQFFLRYLCPVSDGRGPSVRHG